MRHATSIAVTLAVLLATAACQPAQDTPGAAPAAAYAEVGSIERLDPDLDALVPPDARMELLAEGFTWTEGPVWRRSGGYLLFTDIPRNTIYSWSESDGIQVFLRPAGHAGSEPPGWELGSNGLTFDPEDRLVMADHGNRQIARLDEEDFTKTALAEHFEGRRLNSPNDLVFDSRGNLYFTDPPYGLEGLNESPLKELDFSGVYLLRNTGELVLLTRELTFPNGIALSPDETTLYVAVSDRQNPVWMAYDVLDDGTLGAGRVLFDATELVAARKPGMPDGLAVDVAGNLFATGPGGVLVLAPDGRHLGTLLTGQPTANVAFGDDGSTLYITSNTRLLRIRLSTRGLGF